MFSEYVNMFAAVAHLGDGPLLGGEPAVNKETVSDMEQKREHQHFQAREGNIWNNYK